MENEFIGLVLLCVEPCARLISFSALSLPRKMFKSSRAGLLICFQDRVTEGGAFDVLSSKVFVLWDCAQTRGVFSLPDAPPSQCQ